MADPLEEAWREWESLPAAKAPGYEPHPDLTPDLMERLNNTLANLRICVQDHPEDERLAQVEANLRWLMGRRV